MTALPPRTALLAVLLAGCAPATVDTVQPNLVAKSAFDGEWFWLDTVVDVPYGTGVTFEGAQGELERLRWRIEEDLLVGYRSYDHVAQPDTETDDGAPLLAYRIAKHTDIRRAYDPRTGEESNVVQENTERPWYERDYMRVDWSTNLAEPLTPFRLAGVELALTDQHATDPGDRWAPAFDDSDGDGVIDHFRIYRKVVSQPESTLLPGYGTVPTCLFYGRSTVDCAPAEVVIGSSFLRVDDDDRYAGLVYDDRWMETFGMFSTERLHYDRRYGVTEPERLRWANRHALYEDVVERDEDGAPMCRKAGKERVRRCDALTQADRPEVALIPADRREVRPVVYHVAPGFDDDLLDTLPRIEDEWNTAFRDAVNGERFWACMQRREDVERCERVIDPDLTAFVLCPHNPSRAGNPEVCSTDHTGPAGRPDGIPDEVRPGDLRYHLLTLVDAPQTSSPFGYGPSAVDPLGGRVSLSDGQLGLGAGRIVAASANVYTHALDRITASTTDLIRLLDGDLSEDAYVAGENVSAWVEALRERGTTAGLVGHAGDRGDRSGALPDDPAGLLDGMDGGWTAPLWSEIRHLQRPTDPASARTWLDAVEGVIDRSGLVQAGSLDARRRWEALADSPFDERLWTDESVGALGMDPLRASGDPSLLQGHSPLDLLDPGQHDAFDHGLLVAGEHALDLDDGAYTNPALVGLAQSFREEGLTWDEVHDRIRDEMFVSVALHEIGHTVGLRHNFAASTDAWNYAPEYWALRDDGDMGPRHVDPESEAELAGRIREYQYSSVMDYHGNRNGDWHGLGRYDRAAIKFAYAGLVEVMTEVAREPVLTGWSNRDAVGLVSFFYDSTVYPAPILDSPEGGLLEVHYTDYPRLADLQARVDVPWTELVPQLPPEDEGTPGFDSFLVLSRGWPGLADAGAPVAPYRFCSDELAGGAMCARFDEGADPWEITQFHIQDYWDRYVVDYFARERVDFGFGDHVSRVHGRTFRPLQTWMRYYALFHTFLGAEFDEDARAWFAADRGMGNWTAATADNLRFLQQVITRPEPGAFATETRPDGLTILTPAEGRRREIEIPLGAGAYYDSAWAWDSGYHWFERRSRIGTYWDRMVALQVLTTTSPYDFVGFDTSSDPRAYALGYASLYGDAVTDLIGSLVADDLDALAPAWVDGGLRYPDPATDEAGPPTDAARVLPGAYWLVRYSAGLFGSALLREGYDHAFLRSARIWEEGSGDGLSPAEGADVVRFTEPGTGIRWMSLGFGGTDGDGDERGVGARLLSEAETLRAICEGEVPPATPPEADEDEAAFQVQVACTSMQQVVDDIHLQSRISAWFDDRW